jgi:hypothetical protein
MILGNGSPRFKFSNTRSTTFLGSSQKPVAETSTSPITSGTILQLLSEARRLGPVANDRTEKEKAAILELARSLEATNKADELSSSSKSTARSAKTTTTTISVLEEYDLTGLHERLYSTSPGKKRGRIQQRFINSTFLENTVGLGPLQVVATATLTPGDTRTITPGDDDDNNNISSDDIMCSGTNSDNTVTISFHTLSYRIAGIDIPWGRKSLEGRTGTWKILFMGTITDPLDGKRKLLRVMETPSLFILLQDLES